MSKHSLIPKTTMLFSISVLLITLVVTLSGCSTATNPRFTEKESQELISKAQKSKIIVLDVFHNRCESCKHIEPVFEELKTKYSSNPNVVFLKYDLSNPFTIFDSMKIAKALGIDGIYKAQRFSGIVLFIDTKNKNVIDSLVAEYDLNKYTEFLDYNLKVNKQVSNET